MEFIRLENAVLSVLSQPNTVWRSKSVPVPAQRDSENGIQYQSIIDSQAIRRAS
jgi:hypothetical protein